MTAHQPRSATPGTPTAKVAPGERTGLVRRLWTRLVTVPAPTPPDADGYCTDRYCLVTPRIGYAAHKHGTGTLD